jgi:hypothetical protein
MPGGLASSATATPSHVREGLMEGLRSPMADFGNPETGPGKRTLHRLLSVHGFASEFGHAMVGGALGVISIIEGLFDWSELHHGEPSAPPSA